MDRMYQTAVITPTDNDNNVNHNTKEINIPLEKLNTASREFQYTYLLSNLRIVNNPELINYFRWVVSTGVQYCYMNRSLFFINTEDKIINRMDVPLCKNIIANDSLDIMEKDPHLSVFLSKILFTIHNEGTSKMLFVLGKKHSAKSIHFNFAFEYLESVFLSQNPELKMKMRAFLTLTQALTNCINSDGHMESFAFAIYKFFFDSSMNMIGFNYRLISLYITFLAYEKQIRRLPLIFYLTKRYYDSKNISYPHLDALYKKDQFLGKETEEIFKRYEHEVFAAFKVS